MKDATAILLGLRTTDWLSLAAAPTFAAMAILTGSAEGGAQQTSCSMHMSQWSGMAPMYALMSGFHSGPWLKLIERCRKCRGLVRAGELR
ncbi:MAG TPA: hypothetical protein VKQ31_09455 [Steroidobacteraceae bacterium]|nr:hypothetical protein [Steroidobacteraceae bacterium]